MNSRLERCDILVDEVSDAEKRLCWACGTKLSKQQKICLECKNWQNFRRYLNFSSITLSLIIALLSVIGIVGPEIISMLSTPKMTISLTEFKNFTATIEVYEEADRASVIKNPLRCNYIVELQNEEESGEKIELNYEFTSTTGFNKIVIGRELSVFNVKITGKWHDPDVYVPFDSNDELSCQVDEQISNANRKMDIDPEFTNIDVISQEEHSCYSEVIREGKNEKIFFNSPEMRSELLNNYIRSKNGNYQRACIRH